MRSDLYGILGKALNPQTLQADSTSAAIDALTKPRCRFERMTTEQREMMRVGILLNILCMFLVGFWAYVMFV